MIVSGELLKVARVPLANLDVVREESFINGVA